MKDFAGKGAFVTGAAQGIGLGICRALAAEGVRLVMADIAEAPLEAARATLARSGAEAHAIALDVSDGAAVAAAALKAEALLGKLHILVNNAGVVAPPKPLSRYALGEWDWLLGVNLYGAIHGIRAFLPRLRAHGEPGHVVNTASIAAVQVRPGRNTGAYAATKHAVLALSESLAQELAGSTIGVSVLCPSAVNTTIYQASARRPHRFGGPYREPSDDANRESLAGGWPPDRVGARLVAAIRDDELFVFTHEESRSWVEERHRRFMAAFDAAARFEGRVRVGA